MADAHRNFAVSAVAVAPAPAVSGGSLSVTAGHGVRFPAPPPFNVVVCPADEDPTPANAEVLRVTGVASDVFTVTRAQEGSTARAIVVGDRIFAAVTAKTLEDVEGELGLKLDAASAGTTIGESDATGSTVNLDFRTHWGVDGSGNAYYEDDPDDVTPGEEAILTVGPFGKLAVVRPTASGAASVVPVSQAVTDALDVRLDAVESDVTALETADTALDARVDALELAEGVQAVTATTANTTVDIDDGTIVNLAVNANTTLAFTGIAAGKSFTMQAVNGGTFTLSFGASVKFPDGDDPVLSSGAGKIDVYTFFSVDGTNILGFIAGQDLS